MPAPAPAARPTRQDLENSPALSILLNPPETFKGRKVGALVSDGVDAALLGALRKAVEAEGAMLKVVCPMIGGVEASDDSLIEGDEKIDGGPSVVFDAVVVLVSDAGGKLLAKESTARDFVADAFAHLKFIGHNAAAMPLLEKAGVAQDMDGGFVAMESETDAEAFVKACRQLRFWAREPAVKQV